MKLTRKHLAAALLGLILISALSAQQPDAGVIGWYNGEGQSGIPGLANWYLGPDSFSRVYDEFQVPEGGWTVIGVFSDNGLYRFPEVGGASWEIRRGMAPGRGGRVVAWGVAPATQMPEPSVTASRYPTSEVAMHSRVQVNSLQVRLPAGRYWLSVAPVGQGESYLSATRGANAVGMDRERPGIALVQSAGGPAFVPAEAIGKRGRPGQFGFCQHFAPGVIVAK